MKTAKRGRGRPKKEESIQIKLEEALQTMDERAANDLLEMYDIIADTARDPKASATARASNAKYIIALGEKAYNKRMGGVLQETVEQEPDDDDDDEQFFTTDIVSS